MLRVSKDKDARRLENSKHELDKRGRKSSLTERDHRYLEIVLWQVGYDGRLLGWNSLAPESNPKIDGQTIYRHMKQLNYRRCIQKAPHNEWNSRKRC